MGLVLWEVEFFSPLSALYDVGRRKMYLVCMESYVVVWEFRNDVCGNNMRMPANGGCRSRVWFCDSPKGWSYDC